MSSPQVENGFLRIANELYLAALRYQFKQHHKAIYEAIIIKTYGFNKKEDDISLSQLEQMTGILASNCSRACKQLVDLNVIHRRKGVYGHIMGVKKNYRQWQGWDTSWEYWNKDGAEQSEQPAKNPEPNLTAEQTECWEWLKTVGFWQGKVATQADFLKLYLRHNSAAKTQYEEFKSNPKPKYRGKKKPADFELQDFDGDVPDAGNGDFIDGECERME